jgi:MYXO-CTERM domain-containing protein
MSSRALSALAVMALFTSLTSLASAQLPTSGMTLKIENRDVEPTGVVYINKAECSRNFTFSVTLQSSAAGSMTSLIPVVEAWVAQDNSTDCSTPASRMSSGGATPMLSPCWKAWTSSQTININRAFTATIDGDTLFDTDRNSECDELSPGTYRVHFVALPSPTVEATTPAAPVANVTAMNATFTLYSRLPGTPPGLKGRTGESQLGASWGDVDTGPMTTYWLYGDVSGEGGGEGADGGVSCGSGLLTEGMAPPPAEGAIIRSKSTSASGSISDLANVEIGDYVAMGVTAVDIAGNESLLSNVVCVQRVETEGFWEACRTNNTCKDDFETCSATPWRTTRGAMAGLGLAALAGVLVRRRRRNV